MAGGISRRGFLAHGAVGAATTAVMSAGALGIGGTGAAAGARAGGQRVRTGADRLAADGWGTLAGRKVGLITNPTGILADLTHEVDSMLASGAVNLHGIFGPEHGFRGTGQAGDAEDESIDPRTGVSVFNAHGATVDKLANQFRGASVDTVVFDIQDVGARFYTYIWTMYLGMRAAVATGASFVVLDRPNPVGGEAFGPQLMPGFESGVGRKPIALQHGMTVGELAMLFDAEFLPKEPGGGRLTSLEVVQIKEWQRKSRWSTTGLPWVPPSPNMPTPSTALAYPGTCLIEGLTWSEGRGTTRPFEILGAPLPTTAGEAGLDWRWAEELNAAGLPGVEFREAYFRPTFNKHANRPCGGVQIYVTDEWTYKPIRTAVEMIVQARRVYPDAFAWRPDLWIDKLTGSARLREMVERGASGADVVAAWSDELSAFRTLREPYLIYS